MDVSVQQSYAVDVSVLAEHAARASCKASTVACSGSSEPCSNDEKQTLHASMTQATPACTCGCMPACVSTTSQLLDIWTHRDLLDVCNTEIVTPEPDHRMGL